MAGSQQYYPSSIDFDTGTDDPKNPKWYVVWPSVMNRHIIPECVVCFKSSINVSGNFPGISWFPQVVHSSAQFCIVILLKRFFL